MLLAEFYRTHWALDPTTFHTLHLVIDRWASGVRLSAEEIRAAIGDAPAQRQARVAALKAMGVQLDAMRDDGPRPVLESAEQRAAREARDGGGVAVVPAYGILTHRGHTVDNSSQALTSTERLASTLRALVRDPGVAAVCIDFDTPGGSVHGVQELADTIYGLRGEKPIVGVANANANSGGYWAISQCDEVVITPSGGVGSIGVIMAHEDLSGKMEKDGRKVEYVYSGENKAEGNPTGPLSDKTRAHYQALSDTYYEAFTKAVARGRKQGLDVVRSDAWGRGRIVLARDAVANGMADRVDTLENTIARLSKPQGRRSAMSAADATARIAALQLAGAQIDA